MKKFLSLVLALVMTMSLVTISAGAKDFTDAEKVTYTEAVDVISAVKVVGGYEDGSFKPTATLTRGAAAKIICNLILGPTTAGALKADAAPFSDVPANSTFAGYIAYCAKEGIIDGYTDGTFRPSAPLTGYAFMKFLLGALGYDSTIEGYVGSNWSIAVAKRALNIKLDKGLTDDFDGTKPVTREEACLYAFNALNAKAVKYDTKGSNIVVGGVTIATGASEVEVDTDYANYAKKVFGNDLKGVDQDDAYGRPGTKWTYKKTEIGTYADEADATYVGDVKLYALRSDLDLGNSDTPSFYYVANTVDTVKDATGTGNTVKVNYYSSTATTKLSALDTLGYYVGNGVNVEVFYDKDDSNYNRIVVIDEYYDEIKDVDTDDDGRYVEFKTTSGKFYTEDFAKKDTVLVTRGSKSDPAVTVVAAEKLTGKVSKVVGTGTSAKYTIDGTEYKLHHLYTSTAGAGDTVDFYLDSDGNIIKMSITAGSSNVENLVLFTDSKDSGYDKIAKAIYGTGKTETVTLKDADTGLMNVYNFSTSSGKVRVTSNSDYTSTYYGQGGTQYYDFTNGINTIRVDGTTTAITKVDNNTQFVYVDANGDTKTYTGYKNAPSFNNAKKVVTFRKGSDPAALVYVWTAGAASVSYNDKNLTMVIVDSYDVVNTRDENDNPISFYEVRTLSGETVKMDSTKYGELAVYQNAGVVVYTAMGKDSNGIVDTTTKKTTNLYYETSLISTAVIKEDAGVLYMAGTDKAYDDDIVVYEIASNGDTFEKIELNDIDDRAGKYAGYTAITDTDDVVTTLVLKKNP